MYYIFSVFCCCLLSLITITLDDSTVASSSSACLSSRYQGDVCPLGGTRRSRATPWGKGKGNEKENKSEREKDHLELGVGIEGNCISCDCWLLSCALHIDCNASFSSERLLTQEHPQES